MIKDRISLDDVEWGEFRIKDLFDVKNSTPYHKENLKSTSIGVPYITRTSLNNGLDDIIETNESFKTNKSNSISLGAENADFFYQEFNYLAGNKMYNISNKNINKSIGLFLVQVFRKSIKGCGFGYGKGLTGTRFKDRVILLPLDNNGKPNWQFMEDYIKQEQKAIAQKVINYYEDKIIKTGFDLLGLGDAKWGNFRLKELFNIYTGRDIIISNIKEGKYPIVTHSIEKNGIGAYTQKLDNRRLFNHNNTLSLADRGNFYAYTQYHDFYIGTRVKALELKNDFCDKYILQFLATSINKQEVRFSYGFNATNKTDDIKILLPIDEKGEPHWDYMSKFMKKIEQEKLEKALNYIYIYIYSLAICEARKLPKLEEKEWGEFWLEDIVDIKSGVRLTKEKQISGTIPFVGSTDSNNGITNFVANVNDSIDKNVLGVNYNGSVVENFYHPYECIFSDDVKRVSWKEKIASNKYTYLFLKQMILLQKKKYTYGYKFNSNRMNRQKIFFPINKLGKPDYSYMKKYMQIEEIKQAYKIIDYYIKSI